MVLPTAQVSSTTPLTNTLNLPGLASLWNQTLGDPSICIAVLDGPVDQTHPCFEGANLTRLPTLVTESASSGAMSGHGTHITSILFGQHNSPIQGIAPNCRGLILPIFSDNRQRRLSQMDLARAINQAVEHGAHIINISGGELANSGGADPILANAIRNCNDNGVLIVAAAGNNGCDCLHVPAALPAVLAVGAMDPQGLPLDSSNWGKAYQTQGILAPGQDIVGAMPGARVASLSGTSFAAPIVAGIVALLLSLQRQQGEDGNAHAVRAALLKSARPCHPETGADCRRYLAGILNVPGAYALISNGVETMSDTPAQALDQTNGESILPSVVPSNDSAPTDAVSSPSIRPSASVESDAQLVPSVATMPAESSPSVAIPLTGMAPNALPAQVMPSGCDCPTSVSSSSVLPSNTVLSKVYALGELGYDFGTEARRDTFKQLMPSFRAEDSETEVPPNPYDARQMVSYLSTEGNLSEARSLIWTLNLELTPIYAIEPIGEFARDIYELLIGFLAGQVLDGDSSGFIQRISIPGNLSGRSVRLFSGQVVPVIEMKNVRGMYGWRINQLIQAAIDQALGTADEDDEVDEEKLRESLKFFLNRIYYDFRNLGDTSQDRALNFAATNAFQATQIFVDALKAEEGGGSYQLSNISVERSPFCRMDSDCWDVKMVFFNPINDRAARKVFRFTIDVSDVIPVTMGEVRTWKEAS
ncbi:PatA/PatG family cyanobactin maturation protease [Adonisia turfae]|uniref:PatA/PatG family cyanobactin maturation protease n=1 Tax=Adonisia turfae CCMR0081 TaxID=2292702 RepID=A0A6M0RTP1_9CYAN|nr:PatA/PatG family cyanobactin maturation protease [Adonisia turfae]NEZ59638.1 PatA/PatG family cyanobactin maturation protease [Adonisia turfae CCMR0081]